MSNKYAGITALQTFLDNLKNLFATKTEVSGKADKTHNHDDRYYTETEIDTKISNINTSITNITTGDVIVKKAEEANHATSANSANHATSADTATSATTATSADSATKATQDASGNVITDTYETKIDAQEKFDGAKSYVDTKTASTLESAKGYTDTKIDAIVGEGASETLDTIGEISAAIEENQDILETLNSAVGNKADKAHNHDDRYYTEIEIDTQLEGKANATHSHAISDVTNLQTTLDGKAPVSHKHDVTDINNLTATVTELNYMDGVTSGVQSQLNEKVPATRTINGKSLASNITLSASDVSAYTKSEIDNYVFITTDDIDAICGAMIQIASAEGVTF